MLTPCTTSVDLLSRKTVDLLIGHVTRRCNGEKRDRNDREVRRARSRYND